MNFTYTLTKDEIRECRHVWYAFLNTGAVMELRLPKVGADYFDSSSQLQDWLCDDDDNPYAEYDVRFLVKEPACL